MCDDTRNDKHETPEEETKSAREQRRLEIEKEFSYDGYLVIRKELFANLRDAAIMIRNGSITFNTACIDKLQDAVFVRPYFNEKLGRLAIRRTTENDKSSLRWCVLRGSKRKSRRINCKDLTDMFYNSMNWDKTCRYRILGYLIKVDDEDIFVFDFNFTRVFHEHPKKGEPGYEQPIDRKGFFPEDVLNTYGVPAEEYARETEIFEEDGYINAAMLTGPKELDQPLSEDQLPISDHVGSTTPVVVEDPKIDADDIGGDKDE